MKSRTIGKILFAFFAGVLLALGGAILYSRQTAINNPVPISQVSPKPVPRAIARAEIPEPATLPEPPFEVRDEPVSPEPATQPKTQQIGTRPRPAVLVTAKTHRPVQEARLQRTPPVAEPPASGQSPVPALPLADPPATQSAPTTPAVASPADSSQRRQGASSQDPAPQQPHVVTLPAGTTLSIRLRENLNSDRNANGDEFQATLESPVIADGFIIAERQSKVVGHVVQANQAGRVTGLANLTLALSEINTTDGQRVRVETDSYEKWGNSSTKGDAAKVVGGAALGAIIGAIAGGGKGAAIGAGAGGAAGTGVALGTRGSSASIPSESIISFRLARPVTITEKFN